MSTQSNPTAIPPVTESHHVVRERRFSPRVPIDHVIGMLIDADSTGTLHIDFNQGGIGTVRFEERQTLPTK